MLEAFGFSHPPRWLPPVVRTALRMRAGVVSQLPPRRTSRLAADPGNRTYPGFPHGCDLAGVGAPEPVGIDEKWLRKPTRAD